MIKVIASDMDGTLIPHYGDGVPEEMFRMIRKFREHGIQFMAASGRQHANLQYMFRPVRDEIDYLCENGCLVFHDGKLVHQEIMPEDAAIDLLSAFDDKKEYEVLVSGVDTSYVYATSGTFGNFCRDVVHNHVTFVPTIHDIPEPYFKISGWCPDEKHALQEVTYWDRLFGDLFTVVYSGNGWVDFSPKGVTKGSAITWYMNEYGIRKDEVMAFGDNYNDEAMLNDVGFSYAMMSAPKEIRDFCYGTTDSVVATLKDAFRDIL